MLNHEDGWNTCLDNLGRALAAEMRRLALRGGAQAVEREAEDAVDLLGVGGADRGNAGSASTPPTRKTGEAQRSAQQTGTEKSVLWV